MKRKINRVGTSTLTVSLPSKWARIHNLKPGDEIEVEEDKGGLYIGKKAERRKQDITIKVTSAERFMKRFLHVPYIKGYDKIKVEYNDPEVYQKIRYTINLLFTGFEIVEQGRDYCVIKNLTKGEPDDMSKLFRKYFHICKSIMPSLLEAIEKKDMKLIQNVYNTDTLIDKLCSFIRRNLIIGSSNEVMESESLYMITNTLEMIGDECKKIAALIEKEKKFPSEEFIGILKLLIKSLNQYEEFFYSKDHDKMFEHKMLNEKIRAEIIKKYGKGSGSDLLFYHHLYVISDLDHPLVEDVV